MGHKSHFAFTGRVGTCDPAGRLYDVQRGPQPRGQTNPRETAFTAASVRFGTSSFARMLEM